MEYKRCARCGKVKPASEFSKNSATSDGLQAYCKECHKAYMRGYNKRRNQLAQTRWYKLRFMGDKFTGIGVLVPKNGSIPKDAMDYINRKWWLYELVEDLDNQQLPRGLVLQSDANELLVVSDKVNRVVGFDEAVELFAHNMLPVNRAI